MQPQVPVGHTRCYWTLLSTNLNFIYLDPVLASHLGEQRDVLVGKPLLTFVHPDEVHNAKADLGDMLHSKTLHGTVTRVRFCRLSRVRRLLGYDGPNPAWNDAEKVVLDENYMVVDIVTNYAADGIVLCFIHASVDLTPQDSDPIQKTDWTNWCGTPSLPPHEIQALLSSLATYAHPSSSSMSRVFQIFENSSSRSLLMSWPPDSPHDSLSSSRLASMTASVDLGNAQNSPDAKTSCTRRYKYLQCLQGIDQQPQVESIFIPHGSIIFACHKVEQSDSTSNSSLSRSAPITNLHSMGYETATMPPSNPPYYHQQPQSYSLPPITTAPHQYAYMPSQHPASQYKCDTYSGGRYDSYPSSSAGQQQQWSSRSTYWSQQPQYINESSATPSHDPYYSSHHLPSYQLPPPDRDDGAENDIAALVPPPRRRFDHQYEYNSFMSNELSSQQSTSSPKEGRSGRVTGRSSGNRPAGVLRCSSCKATSSPEWRKGPSGKKELCNACGLRYARSRAKKEGTINNHQTSTSHPYQTNGRKRKSSNITGRSSVKTSSNNSLRSVSETPSPSNTNASLNSSISSIGSSISYSPGPGQYNSTPPPTTGGTALTMLPMDMNNSLPPLSGGSTTLQPLQSLHIQSYPMSGGVRRGFVGGYEAPASSADYPRNGSVSPSPHSATGYHNKLTYPPSIPSPLSANYHRSPNEQVTSFERDSERDRQRVKEEEDEKDYVPDDDEDDDEYVDASERRRRAESKYRRPARRNVDRDRHPDQYGNFKEEEDELAQ